MDEFSVLLLVLFYVSEELLVAEEFTEPWEVVVELLTTNENMYELLLRQDRNILLRSLQLTRITAEPAI